MGGDITLWSGGVDGSLDGVYWWRLAGFPENEDRAITLPTEEILG